MCFIRFFVIGGNHICNKVLITGGLGNQLFQICAALALTGEKPLLIDPSYSSIKDEIRRVASEKINFPDNVKFVQPRGTHYLSRKVFNFFIRLSVTEHDALNQDFILRPLLAFGSRYFSWRFKQRMSIVIPSRVGKLDELLPNSGLLFIGYFQNSLYLDQLRSRSSFQLEANEESKEVLALKEIAGEKKVLVMHVRLGDYLNEDRFGIPSVSYYAEGLNLANQKNDFDEIWLFSNDLVGAKKFLPTDFQTQIRFFESVGLDEIHLLQAMSLGSHFILGNSTFGWWAAQFSDNRNKLVVVPKPWFKDILEPEGLIPSDWVRLDAGF